METESLAFTNPATGVQFGEVQVTAPDVVQKAVNDMRCSFPAWSSKSVKERVRILRKFRSLLIDKRDEITDVLNQDCGKSRQDGLIELFITVDMLAQFSSKAPEWLAKKRVSSGLYFLKKCFIEYKPHGVVAVIAPWNYPFTLALPPVLAALLAGNTVVLKPSEVTAATGVLIENLIGQVPELSPYVRVVHGDGQVGAALTTAGPDFIFMTGSTATGKRIMQAASETLTPVALELSGKDAMVVLEDADLDAAARWGAWGAFFNAGQTCMAVERVYVVESKYDEFVKLAVDHAKNFTAGYTTEIDNDYSTGPVIDPRQVKIIDRHLEDALARGACLLTGGKGKGMFYDPMVMVNVDHSMLLMREETFGPILPIMKVKDEAEAVRLANDSSFGLGTSVWSRDLNHAKQVTDQIEAASVIVNDCIAQFGIPMLPFGGVKGSGFGRIHGRDGLLQFTKPYSYAVGGPPLKWDVATILRENGHYGLAVAIMGVLYGTSLRQRWEALSQWLWKKNSRN
jgi:acyl-CoA reductase-like NAD-dependent aldehyde dehydrogenase